MVYVSLGNVCVEILALNKAQKELINDLNVRPGNFQDGLVLFRVKSFALGIDRGRDGAEEVFGKHINDTRIHGFGDDLAVICNVVEQLVQCQALDLLGLHVGAGVVEVENNVTLVDLLHK